MLDFLSLSLFIPFSVCSLIFQASSPVKCFISIFWHGICEVFIYLSVSLSWRVRHLIILVNIKFRNFVKWWEIFLNMYALTIVSFVTSCIIFLQMNGISRRLLLYVILSFQFCGTMRDIFSFGEIEDCGYHLFIYFESY